MASERIDVDKASTSESRAVRAILGLLGRRKKPTLFPLGYESYAAGKVPAVLDYRYLGTCEPRRMSFQQAPTVHRIEKNEDLYTALRISTRMK